jgi:hypothetical protein
MNQFMNPLGSVIDIIPGFVPVDMQTATNTGDGICLKNCAGVLVVAFKAAGTAGDDPKYTIYQQRNVGNTDGGAKALNVIETVWKKQGAALTGVGTWTKETQTADDDYQADATSAESQAVYAFWVPSSALDHADGYDCIRVDCADVGSNAQLGCLLYILAGLRYPTAPENLPSAIVD